MFAVSDKRKQDTAHFNAMQKQLDDDGLGAMLRDLCRMDLGGWHPRDDIPATKGLAQQKTKNLDPQLKWLRGLLDAGTLPWQHDKHPNEARSGKLSATRENSPGLGFWHDTDFADFLSRHGVASANATMAHGGFSSP